jgi:hypothetical protein
MTKKKHFELPPHSLRFEVGILSKEFYRTLIY